jgi:predicted lipoprotein with Yx(FWY)xxD motif
MRAALLAFFLALILAVAACGDDEDSSSAPTEPAAATEASGDSTTESADGDKPKPKPEPGTEITTASSDYGTILWGPDEQAIYLFDKEATDASECYGDCAAAWPPVLTTGTPQPAGDVRADLLGTVPRADGSTQVTYGGHPLYFYAHEGPGQVLCHDVVEFGGTWLVVTPEGSPAP